MFNPIAYLQGVYSELRKSTWPSYQTVAKYFLVVVVGVALATAFIFALDYVFLKGIALLLK